MAALLGIGGAVTPDGIYTYRSKWRKVQPVAEPIAAQLCPCGRVGCDCDEWHEIAHTSPFEDACEVCGGIGCDCITPTAQAALLARIDADPHGYNNLSNLDLPY